MMCKHVAKLLVSAYLSVVAFNAYAFPEFLVEWQNIYGAESPIDDNNATECQICHVSTGGGSAAGWNGYGWRIRELLRPPLSNGITSAIIGAGTQDSDFDDASVANDNEIAQGNHPGWRDGADNAHYFENGSITFNRNPPSLPGIDLDPPSPLSNPLPNIAFGSQSVSLDTIATGFVSPLLALPAPGSNQVLFVVDQVGIIWRVDPQTGVKTRYFDISASSLTAEGNATNIVTLGDAGFGPFDERGLLGLAFHPNFASNGKFYTYQSEKAVYTADFSTVATGKVANHQTVIAEWTVSDPSLSAPTIGSKRNVLVVDQPQFNHNGGMIAFDSDGLLYISIGDGGARDDQDTSINVVNRVSGEVESQVLVDGHGEGNARNPSNPLGSILRIDPNALGASPYTIPPSNPFDGSGAELAEIYAYGLRNSYRFSFDQQNGDLYAADVGQNQIEEVNRIEAGKNYGWNYKEGSFWFNPNGRQNGYITLEENTSAPLDLVDPILQYDHDDGISVTGGYVYRGTELDAGLNGAYIFADWSSDFGVPRGRLLYSDDFNRIQELRIAGQNGTGLFVTGFGQDANGEMYIVGNKTGSPTGETGVLQKIVVPVEEGLCFPVKAADQKIAVICI